MSEIRQLNTQHLARIAVQAIRDYERACDNKMQAESQERFGHRGAYIAEHCPTPAGRIRAVNSAITAYLEEPAT